MKYGHEMWIYIYLYNDLLYGDIKQVDFWEL